MTHFVLWQHSLRHPVCSIVHDRPLNEHERKTKLCEPIAIRESDAALPLDVLARLYPHTNAARTAKIRAVADDVRGDPNTKAIAEAMLKEKGGASS